MSVATVGHILGSKPHRHSKDTSRRVIENAALLGYRPNSSAKAVASGRFHCVTLLLSTDPHRSNVPDKLLCGIYDALAANDYHLNVVRLTDETLSQPSLPKFLCQRMTDGILVNYTDRIPQPLLDGIRADRAPAVWLNSKQDADCVRPDDFGAGKLATEHLLELGHRNILYAVYDTQHYSGEDRYRGYRAAMEAAGLPARLERHVASIADWVSIARNWFQLPDPPTGVVAYGKYPGQAIAYAGHLRGMRVPDDFSLVVFEGSPAVDDTTGTEYTTCLVPERELGAAAVDMLFKKIEEPAVTRPSTPIPFSLSEPFSSAYCTRK